MRIAYDHQIFWWQEYGGISRYYVELANALASMGGNAVTVIAPLYVNQYLRHAKPELRVTGIAVPLWRGSTAAYRALAAFPMRMLLDRFRPDIVHETYYSPERRAPHESRLVLTVFDMIHEKFPDRFQADDPTSRDKAAAVRRADHIICISEHTRRDLIEMLGVPEEKTSVVYLASSIANEHISASVQFDRPYLLYVGSRSGYKNFSSLLKAYAGSALLRDNFLLVCFGGGVFSIKELESQHDLGLSPEQVRYVSGGDDILAGLYSRADAFVCPSIYEGFGIPPLEAMAMGCPVACSGSSSLPEVVGDAAETFDPTNIEEIGAVLGNIVASKEKQARMAQVGRNRASFFTWKKCADQTLAVYQACAAAGGQ